MCIGNYDKSTRQSDFMIISYVHKWKNEFGKASSVKLRRIQISGCLSATENAHILQSQS